MSLFESQHVPPSLESIPKPTQWGKRPVVTLSNLVPKEYVDTVARVASFRVKDKEDRLGAKQVFTGVLEDKTFKVPFICHKTSITIEKDLILWVKSAYVHEFQDKALLLVLTEYSRAEPKYSEGIQEYVWCPRIGHIHRPVWDVTLQGKVSNIYGSSGLVKRCDRCKSIVFDKCPGGCESDWSWDVRISGNLYDGTGSIKVILGRYLASKLLDRKLSEIFYLTKVKNIRTPESFDVLTYNLELPSRLRVVEGLVDEPSRHRHHDRLIITEGNTRICYMKGEKINHDVYEVKERILNSNSRDDLNTIRRFIAKALDIEIRRITGKPQLHGIYLLDQPIALYRCEKAKLYLGFSLEVKVKGGNAVVEAVPRGLVRESVWDYVVWRRGRGASADAVEKTLLKRRPNVVVAPSGHFGRIEELVFRKAGNEKVTEHDLRTFPDFWREVYDVDVNHEEIPLLRIRLMNLERLFTYPPSCVYFDSDFLYLTPGTRGFIETKKASLKWRTDSVVDRALGSLEIGESRLRYLGRGDERVDAQRLLLHDIQKKLLGKTVKARGSVSRFQDRLFLFPRSVFKVG